MKGRPWTDSDPSNTQSGRLADEGTTSQVNVTQLLQERVVNLSERCQAEVLQWNCSQELLPVPYLGRAEVVCQLPAGRQDGSVLHAWFIATVVVCTALTLAVNALVLVTLRRNKKLHTLCNYLVALLCVGNVLYMTAPIMVARWPDLEYPVCSLRALVWRACRSNTVYTFFALGIVRYCNVVHGKMFDVTYKSLAATTSLLYSAVGISIYLKSRLTMFEYCPATLVLSPQLYTVLTTMKTNNISSATAFMINLLGGLLFLLLLYTAIFYKTCRARRNLRRTNHTHRNTARTTGSISMGTSNVVLVHPQRQETPSAPANTSTTSGVHRLRRSRGVELAQSTRNPPTIRDSWNPTPSRRRSIKVSSSQLHACSAHRLSTIPEEDEGACCTASAPSSTLQLDNIHLMKIDNNVSSHGHESPAATAARPRPAPAPRNQPQPTEGTNASAETIPVVATAREPNATATAASGATNRGGNNLSNKVELVAGLALFCMVFNYLVGLVPRQLVTMWMTSRPCVSFPDERMIAWLVITVSACVSSVSDPIICLVFSRDFRDAFRQTCRRLGRA